MEIVFVSYNVMPRLHGLSGLTKENPEVAVKDVLYFIKPGSFRHRLESYFGRGHSSLKQRFRAFIQHAIILADDFQLLDIGTKASKTRSQSD